jgi:6-pyruvoyltetrahydropterin/6-carboxytetrahydropterin synthase
MGPAQRRFGLQANPTAENMARFLLEVVAPIELHGTGVEVVQVTLWETENCYAVARLEN